MIPSQRTHGNGNASCFAGRIILFTVLALLSTRPTRTNAACPPAWSQRGALASPSPRSDHAMAYDSRRGVTVLFGGWGASSNETWEWDGLTWYLRTPATAPPWRMLHAMAYDSARGVTVLFGGGSPGALADTWEWDGTNWAQRTPATSPSARTGHAMAYDQARGVTVLFGGDAANGMQRLGDTWEWNGTNWTQRTPATSPSARAHHALAFDSARGLVVLFGGQGSNWFDDTWEWDGANWTQRTAGAGPGARIGQAMTYDSARHVTVLFAGRSSSAYLNDTWEWDGGNWSQQASLPAQTGRCDHALVYDQARAETVLFGGIYMSYSNFGDTWVYGAPPGVLQQPLDCTVISGSDAAFGVFVAAPFGASSVFQWRKNGIPLAEGVGPNKAFLHIPHAGPDDAGSYDCVISAGECQITSTAATLTVLGFQPDFNADGHVDMIDFGLFQGCITGPAILIDPDCTQPAELPSGPSR